MNGSPVNEHARRVRVLDVGEVLGLQQHDDSVAVDARLAVDDGARRTGERLTSASIAGRIMAKWFRGELTNQAGLRDAIADAIFAASVQSREIERETAPGSQGGA